MKKNLPFVPPVRVLSRVRTTFPLPALLVGLGILLTYSVRGQAPRLPDLVVLDAEVTAANRFPNLGRTRTIYYAATNQGNATAYNARTGIYLSSDAVLSDDDRFVQEGALIKTSSPQGRLRASGVVVIPADVAAGNYFLIVRTDYLNNVAELDEDNNTAAVAIWLGASDEDAPPPPPTTNSFDLQVTAALEENDRQAEAGERVTLDYVVRNNGDDEVDDPLVGFYLSEDDSFDEDDIFLESEDLSDLDGGESDDENEQVPLPNNVAAGDYFLLVVVDPFNNISETDESNNVSASPIAIGSEANDELTAVGEVQVIIQDSVAARDGVAPAKSPALLDKAESPVVSNYPNPFQGQTLIHYTLPRATQVELVVYTMYGQEVARLVDMQQSAGTYTVPFVTDRSLTGALLYRLSTDQRQQVGRMLLE